MYQTRDQQCSALIRWAATSDKGVVAALVIWLWGGESQHCQRWWAARWLGHQLAENGLRCSDFSQPVPAFESAHDLHSREWHAINMISVHTEARAFSCSSGWNPTHIGPCGQFQKHSRHQAVSKKTLSMALRVGVRKEAANFIYFCFLTSLASWFHIC